jgi:hypothetical protein
MYGPAASQIALACAGTQTFFQTATQTNLPIAGTAAAPSLYFSTDTTSGLYRVAANILGVAISGAQVCNFATGGVSVTGTLSTGAGTISAPSFYLSSDTGTGFYRSASNTWDWVTGSTSYFRLSSSGILTTNAAATTAMSTGAGAVGTPSFYLSTDTTSGIYRPSANVIGVTISGSQVANFSSTGLAVTGKTTTSTLQVGTPGTTTNCIQTGSYTFVSPTLIAGCGSVATTTITFGTAFSSTPNVVATVANPGSEGVALNCLIVSSWYVSTTGFTLGITNAHPSADGSGSPTISWFAWN